MEQLVRPYQTQDVSPAQQVIDPGFSESNAPVWLRIGLSGKGKVFNRSAAASNTVYMIKKPKENSSSS
jgi:hypothetical protein